MLVGTTLNRYRILYVLVFKEIASIVRSLASTCVTSNLKSVKRCSSVTGTIRSFIVTFSVDERLLRVLLDAAVHSTS